MSDEVGFIRAIAADPYADAPRLIYADCLDENGSPERAAFLRAECEWAADPGVSRAAQEAMARLSLMAWPLEPSWVAAVSRVGVEVAEAAGIATTLAGVEPYSREVADDPFTTWADGVRRYEAGMRWAFGRGAKRRTCLPLDYLVFGVSEAGWWNFDRLGVGGGLLCGAARPSYVDWFAEQEGHWDRDLKGHGHAGLRSVVRRRGAWAILADFYTNGRYFVCVDAGDPMFGSTAMTDMYDPYTGEITPAELERIEPTFLGWLRRELPQQLRLMGNNYERDPAWYVANTAHAGDYAATFGPDPTPWLGRRRR